MKCIGKHQKFCPQPLLQVSEVQYEKPFKIELLNEKRETSTLQNELLSRKGKTVEL